MFLKRLPKVQRKISKKNQLLKFLKKKLFQLKSLLKIKLRVQRNLRQAKKVRVQKNNWKKKLSLKKLIQKKIRDLQPQKFQKIKKGKALNKNSKAHLLILLIKSLSCLTSFKKFIQKKLCQLSFFTLLRKEVSCNQLILIKKWLKSQHF